MNIFEKEIAQQPQAVLDAATFEGLDKVAELWASGKYDKVLFTGMGSSWFVAEAAALLLSGRGVNALALNAGELLHYAMHTITPSTILVLISQSGRSYETIRVMELAGNDVTVVGICNEPDSPLGKRADLLLLCHAGEELMTSTKTFITTWQLALAFSDALTGVTRDCSDWKNIAASIASVIADTSWRKAAEEYIGIPTAIQTIGRGPLMAAARQAALMFMEASHTLGSALTGGDFRHGPLEMVSDGMVCFILTHSKSKTYSTAERLANDILKYGGKPVIVSDEPMPGFFTISVPCPDETLAPMTDIIPLQLIVNDLACRKGMTPGIFEHGNKVTEIE